MVLGPEALNIGYSNPLRPKCEVSTQDLNELRFLKHIVYLEPLGPGNEVEALHASKQEETKQPPGFVIWILAQRVQVPNIQGFWFQQSYPSLFLGPES